VFDGAYDRLLVLARGYRRIDTKDRFKVQIADCILVIDSMLQHSQLHRTTSRSPHRLCLI
jgi:hypothetical protein